MKGAIFLLMSKSQKRRNLDMQDTQPLLLDAGGAGRLLGLSSVKVIRFTRRGELPHVVLPGGELRYLESDLRQWIEDLRQPKGV